MVFPAALGVVSVLGGHAARIGINQTSARAFGSQFVQSLPFGAGYSLGTYLGFPKNYQERKSYSRQASTFNLMPYGYYPRRRYSRYGRSRYSRYRRTRRYRSYRRY